MTENLVLGGAMNAKLILCQFCNMVKPPEAFKGFVSQLYVFKRQAGFCALDLVHHFVVSLSFCREQICNRNPTRSVDNVAWKGRFR